MTIAQAHHTGAAALCLANARLVLPDRVVTGRLVSAEGQIAAIEETAAVPPGAHDLEGAYLLPGLVELHTDNLERHITPRPKVDWPRAAAIAAHDGELASCGITTVFDALRVGSMRDTAHGYRPYARKVAQEIMALRAAGALRIRHLIHLRAEVCSETLAEELDAFGPEDRIGLVSMMDHTPGQRQFRDVSKLKDYMQGKHAMTDAGFDAHVAHLSAVHAAYGTLHEAATVAAAGRLGAVLASHDDTTAEQVAQSAQWGVGLAEFPTTEEAALACRDAGIAIMMGAPNLIRGGSHSGNVAAQTLAERGLLDILSSDYVPSALLGAAFRLAALWEDLPRAVATVTATPARAAGLSDRGAIAVGLAADLVAVRLFGDTPVAQAVWVRGERAA